MGPLITIEDRLQVEVERRWLAAPGGTPAEALDDFADAPVLRDRERWGVVRASDLGDLLQPWTERPAIENDRITKVAGARYITLTGLIDESWMRALVDDGSGRVAPWRERDGKVEGAMLKIVGTDADLRRLLAPRTRGAIETMLRRSSGIEPEVDWLLQPFVGASVADAAAWIAAWFDRDEAAGLALVRRDLIAARQLLIDQAGQVDPLDKLMLRRLRNLREVERLIELMRHAAATGCGCEELLVALSHPQMTALTMVTGGAPAGAIADAWMHTGALHA